MRCSKCNKPQKENTEGNNRYCQGHSIMESDQDLVTCKFCNSHELHYDDGVGDYYCYSCGKWQNNGEK